MFSTSYNNLSPGPYQTFVSRPDLTPPLLNVNGSGTPGYVFFAQRGENVHQPGLIIADNHGTIVYVDGSYDNDAFEFVAQTYQGKDVMTVTYWNGTGTFNGVGQGQYIMMDNSYNNVANFTTYNGTSGDVHEFRILNDTGLLSISKIVPYDLRPWGGQKSGFVYSGGFQQVDLCTSTVLFEWDSINHISPNESFAMLEGGVNGAGTQDNPWDYFHINSIDLSPYDGTFLVSARHTSTLYKIANSSDGEVLWRLTGGNGGKDGGFGNFTLLEGVQFEWQHDARWRSPTEISLFDNAAQSLQVVNETFSRGLRLSINETDPGNMTATLIMSLVDTIANSSSGSQGNLQYLSNGNFFVGFGVQPIGTEFDAKGNIVSEFQLSPYFSDVEAYRMFKMNFTANPQTIPDIALADSTVFVSWNGATEVVRWNIYSGPSPTDLSFFRPVNKTGFETSFRFLPITGINPQINYTQIGAVNKQGQVIGLTQIVRGGGDTVEHDKGNIQLTTSNPPVQSFSCLPASVNRGRGRAGLVRYMWGMVWAMTILAWILS